jgi:hypothetical protein
MDMVMSIGCVVGGLIGIMLSFYLALCFICWLGDVIDNQKRRWKK